MGKPSYNTVVLRELLHEALSSEAFGIFCYDFFRPVVRQFSPNMNHTLMVQALIAYCEEHGKIEELLERIKEANEYQYNRYKDDLLGGNTTGETERETEIAQVQTMLAQIRRATWLLREQVAGYGGRTYTPVHILLSIEDNEKQITQLEQRLRTLQGE